MIDDRVEQLLERRAERVDRTVVTRLRRRETRHQVGAHAERRAGTGDHHRAEVRIPDQMIPEHRAELTVECVPSIRAVDRRQTYEPSDLEPDHRAFRTRRSGR